MKPLITMIALFLIHTIACAQTQEDQTTKVNKKNELSFYEKRYLNDPIMQFESDRLRTRLDQHVYQIREGSRGGYDSAGGACGCN